MQLITSRDNPLLQRLRRLFREHGLPECIHSDNGAPFASTGIVLFLSTTPWQSPTRRNRSFLAMVMFWFDVGV